MTAELPDGDILLVVPPFAHLSWPHLGVHVLQAVAREAGHDTAVLYGNLHYAARVGRLTYAGLCNTPGEWLLGERIFRQAAFGLPRLGEGLEDVLSHPLEDGDAATRYTDQLSDATGEVWEGAGIHFTRSELLAFSDAAVEWADTLAEAIVAQGYPVVGATTMFEQTGASLALLRRVKALAPDTVTLLGGANCDGDMATALADISEGVDHIFAGESEAVFRRFLDEGADDRILRGTPCQDLDALPPPDFDAYFDQIRQVLPEMLDDPIWLSYETSRGCWWGQKQHCTFCGLNAFGMGFREKSPEVVLRDFSALLDRHPTHRVAMTDNIMPFRYHKSLVPKMTEELPDVHVFYEQKANLTLHQVHGLKQAGNNVIQPGIESLSTEVLRLMRKGVLARQNIALLRYARSVGMGVKWNLLYGFPGDRAEAYAEMLEILPALAHLAPPNALTHLSIDRFSPYFDDPDDFGITEVHPLPAYGQVFPDGTDLSSLAYHFQGSWESGSKGSPELMGKLFAAVVAWRRAWDPTAREQPPHLHVRALPGERYVLYDTRELGGVPYQELGPAQAITVLVGGPKDRVPLASWALHNRYAVDVDGWCVPLATSDVHTLDRLEARRPEVREAGQVLELGSARR